MKPLIVWTGPMGSAKTTSALHAARRYQRFGKNVKLIRPVCSLRSHETPGKLVTKNGESFPAIEVESADEVFDKVKDADIVWIDEVFLFKDEEKLFDIIAKLRQSKEILISAIGADCFMNPFRQTMPRLLAVADDIIFCKADCDCCGEMGKASRHVIGVAITEGETHVGGSESYATTCAKCWTNLMELPPEKRLQGLKRR